MNSIERPPAPFALPGGKVVHIVTQRWVLEPWDGEPDPPGVPLIWSRKPKFPVKGSRSCAELAVVHHLRSDGWDGVWVCAFGGGGHLRSLWFPAPALESLAEAGAPTWAVKVFDRFVAASGGKFGGFFDAFAWRGHGEIRFDEVKAGKDRITGTQRRFVEQALRFHDLEQFTVIEVAR